MLGELYQQTLIKNPLSEDTRKERRLLLVTSTLGLVVVKAGFLPTKISALGIEFSQTDQSKLLHVLIVIIGYFLVAFILYTISDLLNYRIENYFTALKQRLGQIAVMGESLKKQEENNINLKAIMEDWIVLNKKLNELNEDLRNHAGFLQKYASELEALIISERTEENEQKIALLESSIRKKIDRSKELEELSKIFNKEMETKVSQLIKEQENSERIGASANLEFSSAKEQPEIFLNSSIIMAIFRIIFECFIPIAIAVYSIISLARGH